MMNFTLLGNDEIRALKDFLDPEIYEGFFTTNCRYAIALSENGTVCGVGVFDAKKYIEILDIVVTDGYKGRLESTILNEILQLVLELPYEGIFMEVFDSEGQQNVVNALTDEAFREVSTRTLFRFDLEDLDSNPILSRFDSFKNVYPLKAADNLAKKAFSNILIKNELFDHFMSEDISEDLSSVYMRDDKILGCVLIHVIDDKSFYVDYVFVSEEAGPSALPAMLASSADKLVYYFDEIGADGYILSTDEKTEGLIMKMLPDAEVVERRRTFAC